MNAGRVRVLRLHSTTIRFWNTDESMSQLKKMISFAGLDVYLKEPINKNSYLTKIKNCILSSHNAFNCKEEVDFVNKNTLNNLILNLK